MKLDAILEERKWKNILSGKKYDSVESAFDGENRMIEYQRTKWKIQDDTWSVEKAGVQGRRQERCFNSFVAEGQGNQATTLPYVTPFVASLVFLAYSSIHRGGCNYTGLKTWRQFPPEFQCTRRTVARSILRRPSSFWNLTKANWRLLLLTFEISKISGNSLLPNSRLRNASGCQAQRESAEWISSQRINVSFVLVAIWHR